MTLNRKKVLLLSTHDSHLGGHAWDAMKFYDKDRYDVKLLTLYSLYNDKSHALFKSYLLYRLYRKFIVPLINLFTWGSLTTTVIDNKYSFFDTNYSLFSAKYILKKYGELLPDVIVLHWYDGFINARIIRDLYDATKAKIVFVFTDEFPLGGGCHYPCECSGYTKSCIDCPAVSDKYIPRRIMQEKIRLLCSIPKIVIAPTAGIMQAQMSTIFKSNTQYLKAIRGVNLKLNISVIDARQYFNVPMDKFVIMFGALNILEERKGFKYLVATLKILSQQLKQDIIALVPGNTGMQLFFDKISIRFLGMLDFDNLCKSYIASNVYVSPSIADAGPMMVKYSIACGTPVVAFPIGYSLDLIQHKETGYIAKMFDVDDLARGIYYFYENQSRQMYFHNNCLQLNNELCKNDSVYNYL